VSATDDFVAACLAAVAADQEGIAAKEVVERAVRDRRLVEELSDDDGVRVVHGSEGLTILHVVMPMRPADAGKPIPHNHRMSAVIGVIHGSEENHFFERSTATLEPVGGRVLAEGDVLVMDKDTIHSVKNPSSELPTSALHVYSGDLIAAEKSMWPEPDGTEQPFDFFRVIGS
jgi:predicted metal-dependent enzyme (double-stranded beta helix superfamily)